MNIFFNICIIITILYLFFISMSYIFNSESKFILKTISNNMILINIFLACFLVSQINLEEVILKIITFFRNENNSSKKDGKSENLFLSTLEKISSEK